MPDPNGGPNPLIWEAFFDSRERAPNDVSHTTGHPDTAPLCLYTDFVNHEYEIISAMYQLSVQDLAQDAAEHDLFALDSLAKQIPRFIDDQWDGGPFVLSHLDLRHANIIVDDDLHVQGIIDWEWVVAVPRKLFVPPSWITGHDARLWNIQNELFSDFCEVLRSGSGAHGRYDQLRDDWDSPRKLALPIAHTLLHPSQFTRIYYKFVYPQLFDQPRLEVVSEFCGKDAQLPSRVRALVDNSHRFTQYLKENRLYVVDKQAVELKKMAEELRELEAMLDSST